MSSETINLLHDQADVFVRRAQGPYSLFSLWRNNRGKYSTCSANDHEIVDKAGAREVDPPRLVHACHTDPASVLYQIPPFVPLTIMAMFAPCVETATGLLVVPPVSSQLVDQTPPMARDLSNIRPSAPTTNR